MPFITDFSCCPVTTFKFYKSKLNPNSLFLWQKPRQGRLHYTDEIWYEPRRVGKDLLERYMKFLQKSVKLDGDYTNHSIRAMVITNLDRDGFEGRHIIKLSSHKSENTIKEYSVQCPDSKRKEMFDSLTNKMKPKKKKTNSTTTPCETLAIAPKDPVPVSSENNTIATESAIVPEIQDVKDNLPSFDLLPLDDMATIDDKVLSDLLNNEFDTAINEASPQDPVSALNPSNAVVSKTINTQVNTVNIPQNNMPKLLVMYFPNSSVTINYNFGK